ncbi:(Fe-S)-binding protein [candidate division CSSED10-310 bacterium]|uniref:(Fe-S)-binding protein n=1 Tax=candidate division CSSED10-310 bacterium TaxID=2855610 RepID=A0ABV6Z0Y7_UNCC1
METHVKETAPKYSYHIEQFDLRERPRRFLEAFAAILKHSNYGAVLDFYSRITTKCARCTVTCPVYQASDDVRDIPCNRSELLFKIYRRYFTLGGMLRARLWDSFILTEDYIDRMAEEFWRCTACRRCKLSCPMGIDHAMITHLTRWILSEIGMVPKALVVSVREQLEGKTRNTSAVPKIAMKDSCEFLEEELEEELGDRFPEEGIKFPIDVEGAEYVFFPAVSDYLMEAETLMGNAAVMHAMGVSWTIGSGNFDGIDYGLFYSDRMWDRIIKAQVAEIKRLGGKVMLIGECGHASRSAREGMQNFIPPEERVPVINCMELAYENFLSGKLKLKKGVIKERTTYHDPCNIARSGWIVDQPRVLLRHICQDFVEMTPGGKDNYCCGGGGGTVSIDEIKDFRMRIGGKTKADQIKQTGAHYIVTPCANCKKQIDEIIDFFKIDAQRIGLHDLLLRAVEFD